MFFDFSIGTARFLQFFSRNEDYTAHREQGREALPRPSPHPALLPTLVRSLIYISAISTIEFNCFSFFRMIFYFDV